MAQAFPLAWPDGWPRTQFRRRAPYKFLEPAAIQHLRDELRRLNAIASTIVISSNRAYGKAEEPNDPGVAVYWSTNAFKDRVVASDKWDRTRDNVHAIGLAIQALRAIERAGASQILERAFTAFGALPAAAGATVARAWWEVFNFPEALIGSLSTSVVVARYRELAARAHPDKGGSDAEMAELNAALEQAKRHYG